MAFSEQLACTLSAGRMTRSLRPLEGQLHNAREHRSAFSFVRQHFCLEEVTLSPLHLLLFNWALSHPKDCTANSLLPVQL